MRDELQRYAETGGRVAVIGRHHLRRRHRAARQHRGRPDGRRARPRSRAPAASRSLSGSLGLTTVADRLDGVHEAMRAAGLDPDDVPVIEEAFTRDGGRAGAIRILNEHPDTTAVVALNDDMAIGCLSELRRARIAVPGRMTVTGFDDVAVAGDLSPGLTTIRLPMADMGARALALALKEPGSRPRKQRVPAELVVRGSSGPAPGLSAGMRVVVATDKFKGSLTAAEVAESLGRGLRRVGPRCRGGPGPGRGRRRRHPRRLRVRWLRAAPGHGVRAGRRAGVDGVRPPR